jgi:ABC-type cobalamin/Fe3+-siderophores transport system ATPase subunit
VSGLRVVRLEAENVKRLKAVEIAPKGNVVEITGRNGQGKSSILDALWWALAGTGGIQDKPIREGADSAKITIDLGDLIVKRTLRRKSEGDGFTPSLRVEGADGQSFKSPQTILDGLLSSLTFEPLAFERKPAREQFDELRRFVPDMDFEALDNLTRGDMERRRDANRDAKTKRAAAEIIPVPENFEPVDEQAIIDALANAAEHNDLVAKRASRRDEAKSRADSLVASANAKREESERLSQRAKQLLEESASEADEAEDLRARLASADPLPEAVQVEDLKAKLNGARATNAAGARVSEKRRLVQEAEALEAEADALTSRMATREEQKREAIKKANLPVEGLSFGDGCILLNGLPFNQASAAERLKASIAIAMAGNSRLRVVRVSEGALLDAESFRVLEEMAARFDAQVWVETVASSRESAIVIEDGEVKQ